MQGWWHRDQELGLGVGSRGSLLPSATKELEPGAGVSTEPRRQLCPFPGCSHCPPVEHLQTEELGKHLLPGESTFLCLA